MTETSNRDGAIRDLPEAYRRKPDPSEPWRYVCPDCGGQILSKRRGHTYRCNRCFGHWKFRELHDKKRFGEVSES